MKQKNPAFHHLHPNQITFSILVPSMPSMLPLYHDHLVCLNKQTKPTASLSLSLSLFLPLPSPHADEEDPKGAQQIRHIHQLRKSRQRARDVREASPTVKSGGSSGRPVGSVEAAKAVLSRLARPFGLEPREQISDHVSIDH